MSRWVVIHSRVCEVLRRIWVTGRMLRRCKWMMIRGRLHEAVIQHGKLCGQTYGGGTVWLHEVREGRIHGVYRGYDIAVEGVWDGYGRCVELYGDGTVVEQLCARVERYEGSGVGMASTSVYRYLTASGVDVRTVVGIGDLQDTGMVPEDMDDDG